MEEIARVYARALFEIAVEHAKLDVVREQIAEFADALDKDRSLAVFFFSPYFSTQERKDGLARAVQGADEAVMNFLEMLIESHRMPVIFRIRRQLDELWEQHNRLLAVEVTSAIELDERLVAEVGERISKQTGRRVQLTARIEPDILGGIVLRVGNSVLDASIRHRLQSLRQLVAH
jgi:F-type H+-transporting ATPase subunit delta